MSWSSFRFTEKLSTKHRGFSLTPGPTHAHNVLIMDIFYQGDAFVIADEHTVITSKSSRSMVYINIILGVVHSVNLKKMYDDL